MIVSYLLCTCSNIFSILICAATFSTRTHLLMCTILFVALLYLPQILELVLIDLYYAVSLYNLAQ